MLSKFRQAKLSDIDDIMMIEKECFPDGMRESRLEYINRLKVFPKGNIVCVVNDICVGCICSEIWQVNKINNELFMCSDSLNELHTKNGNTLYITTNALLKAYRGQGSGKKLFTELLTRMTKNFPNICKYLLIVGQPWIAAQSIYKKEEFKKVLLLQNYFEPFHHKSFNGIVMMKTIKNTSSEI